MTIPEFYTPDRLTGTQLDTFLAKGWYRMYQHIFTTNYILAEDYKEYRVFWLRYTLPAFNMSKSQQKLLRTNKRFSVAIKPLVITDEIEALYELYKTGIAFEGAPGVAFWLYENRENNKVFETDIIEIRDEGELIAAGIFDKGDKSIAGIMNFYHPGYKKFSLGKYLILLKMQHAMSLGKRWYYPGYIVYGYPAFDYKLFAGKENVQVYIPESKHWQIYDQAMLDNIVKLRNTDK